MSKVNKKFYITTPIYYVNASPHIGHTYTTVAADVIARFHKMIGDEIFFLTGTDEHGAKIEEQAQKIGKKPQDFVNEIAAQFQFVWKELNIFNNNFIRTSNQAHIKAVQKAIQHMYNRGDIYLGKHKGLYCQGCEQYLNKKDLVNGKCPDHKTVPKKISEESYMFKLSKYGKKLLEKIEKDELKIRPKERKNEIISFYKKQGLKDISFSRKNVKWGVSLPWDKSHTVYVWSDAFLNYLTGLGWKGDTDKVPNFWPANMHLMSKDILRVHATIWPAMLLSLGLPLPKEIFVHGYFLINGQKMSKSIGNVIAPGDLIKKYGVDGTRYLLMSATGFGHDGDISWDQFDEKYNADLANGIGNLLARSITLAEKMEKTNLKLKITKFENLLIGTNKNNTEGYFKKYKEKLLRMQIDQAVNIAFAAVKWADNYISDKKPWELIKNNDKQAGIVMYNMLETLRHIAWMLWPFMPETAEKIWQQLGLNSSEELAKDFQKAIKWGGLKPGAKVKKGEILFPRI